MDVRIGSFTNNLKEGSGNWSQVLVFLFNLHPCRVYRDRPNQFAPGGTPPIGYAIDNYQFGLNGVALGCSTP